MKRISIWLIAFIGLASCGRTEFNTNNDLAREGLKGPVESYYEINVYLGSPEKNPKECNDYAGWVKYYNQAGNLVSIDYFDDGTEDIYEYSESGLLQCIKDVDHFHGEEVTYAREYKYDDAGRLLAVDAIRYKTDGTAKVFPGVQNYTYEDHPSGALIRKEYDDKSEPNLWKIDITNAPEGTEMELFHQYKDEYCDIDIYDTDGNLRLTISESGDQIWGKRYIYDSNGKVQNVIGLFHRYDFPHSEIKVNDKGDIESMVVYNYSNNETVEFDRTDIKYKYDKYGNWTSKTIKTTGVYGTYYSHYKRAFTYYE